MLQIIQPQQYCKPRILQLFPSFCFYYYLDEVLPVPDTQYTMTDTILIVFFPVFSLAKVRLQYVYKCTIYKHSSGCLLKLNVNCITINQFCVFKERAWPERKTQASRGSRHHMNLDKRINQAISNEVIYCSSFFLVHYCILTFLYFNLYNKCILLVTLILKKMKEFFNQMRSGSVSDRRAFSSPGYHSLQELYCCWRPVLLHS